MCDDAGRARHRISDRIALPVSVMQRAPVLPVFLDLFRRWIVVVFHVGGHLLRENRATAAPNWVLARPSRKVRARSPHRPLQRQAREVASDPSRSRRAGGCGNEEPGMADRSVRNLRPFSARAMTSVHGRIIGSFRPGRFEPMVISQAGEAGVVRRIGGPISAAAIPDMASANAGRSRAAR